MKPKVYSQELVITDDHLDELKHVNNVVYIGFLQEIATAHWYSTVNPEVSDPLRWVVRKHEIEYLKPATLGQTLTINTWIDNFDGISCYRKYEILSQNRLIVQATTHWVALDAETMKPKRIQIDHLIPLFFEK